MNRLELNKLIREALKEILNEDATFKKPNMNTIKPGSSYLLSYGGNEIEAKFIRKFKDTNNQEIMEFKGEGTSRGSFEVYKNNNYWTIGTNKQRVNVIEEL